MLLFSTRADPIPPEAAIPGVSTEMCLLVSESGPVNLDTIFHIGSIKSRIYAYSFLDSGFNILDAVWHTWYSGSELVKSVPCSFDNLSCVSSVSIDSLSPGDWSVDTKQNDILLHVKQFRVE
ncbi:MAG: hypothetical protein LBC85_07850 [Fibromonadaceae bacterium]|nr:hypothetical protein [Fibromonadaceae bacterium]